MSLPSPRQARLFLAPLQEKVTVFVVDGREANLSLARFLLGCICAANRTALVLDTDASYASNARTLASELSETCLARIALRIPTAGPKLSLVTSIFSEYDTLIVDDLNTIYHLLSMEDRSAVRQLTAVGRILSYHCRKNGTTAFLTAYSPAETARKATGQRSILRIGDVAVSMSRAGSKLSFRCDHGVAWPDNPFSVDL